MITIDSTRNYIPSNSGLSGLTLKKVNFQVNYPEFSQDYIYKWFQDHDLLSEGESNAKQAKNKFYGNFTSYNLSLLPANLSGYSTCKNFNTCIKSCIGTNSGHNKFMNSHIGKYKKTLFLAYFPEIFKDKLTSEVRCKGYKAIHRGSIPLFRLNNYSDLPVEEWYANLLEFHQFIFMDYTKIFNRPKLHEACVNHGNLYITGSITDKTLADYRGIDRMLERRIKNSDGIHNFAIVVSKSIFDTYFSDLKSNEYLSVHRKSSQLPLNLYNGDNHDLTFLRPKNSILILREKTNIDDDGLIIRNVDKIGLNNDFTRMVDPS